MKLEQLLLIVFAGGPGLTALIIQLVKIHSEAPEREANLAQTLTTTAGSMLDRLQAEIDTLKTELRVAEDQIIKLEARLEATQNFALEASREREKRAILELEVARLRGIAATASEEQETYNKEASDSRRRIEASLDEVSHQNESKKD